MAASLAHIHAGTPMGANLISNGATFRVWAPHAHSVHVIGDFNGRIRNANSLLTRDANSHWRGFIPGVKDRDHYLFYIVGDGGEGPKRDPYARELHTPFPGDCIVRERDFPWHETGFRTPDYNNFVIYQLHVGTFYTPNLPKNAGTFLDVADKIEHFDRLGITAIQLLPIQEFQTSFSQGYNGTDYFSPEMDFGVADADLKPYVARMNKLLQKKGLDPYVLEDLRGEMNQLKALVDLCHVHGIAVLLDVVYNHAGGSFGDESLEFFDRQDPAGGWQNTLYFGPNGHAGGRVFDYRKPEVRDFLIQNAKYYLDEYRVDGFRYDQVSVIDHDGQPDGWSFCQALTSTVRHHKPDALQKAEYWGVNPIVVKRPYEGAGFDTSLTDGLRIAIRDVIGESSQPDERPLNMARLGWSLWPEGFHQHWQFVQGPENHDIVQRDRELRIARLGHPDSPRSWYARSRARVATGISLTAPGIPMLFMGQEFLEDKQWSDDLDHHKNLLLYWEGLEKGDKQMHDHLRFTRELINLRWNQPALRGQGFDLFYGFNCQVHAHNHYPKFLWRNDTKEILPGNDRTLNGETYSQDKFTEVALEFIRENKDAPFFLYLPFAVPHLSIQVTEESLNEYKGKIPETEYVHKGYLEHPFPHAGYAAMISHMDRDVGKVMDLIDELGLDDNTIIFFTSDNGPTYNRLGGSDSEFFRSAGDFKGFKGSLYEGGIREPLVARWPGHILPGTVSDHRSAFWDVLPTLCDIAGVKPPQNIDGISLAPTLFGHPDQQQQHAYLYWEFPAYGGQQAVRMGQWKGIRQNMMKGNLHTELYDLSQDVGESKDVSAGHPEVVQQIETIMRTARVPSEVFPFKPLDEWQAKAGK